MAGPEIRYRPRFTNRRKIHFAGEYANSFYIWQGFREGAALSGIQAAGEILDAIQDGVNVRGRPGARAARKR